MIGSCSMYHGVSKLVKLFFGPTTAGCTDDSMVDKPRLLTYSG